MPNEVKPKPEPREEPQTVSYTGATELKTPEPYRLLLVPTETWIKVIAGFVIGAVTAMTSVFLTIAPERSILVSKIVPNAQGLATIDPLTTQKIALGRVLSEQGVLQINTWTLLNALAQQCFNAQNAPVAPKQPVMPPSGE